MTEIEIQIQMEMNSKQTARGMSGAEGRGRMSCCCTNLQIDFNRKAQREADRN